MRISLVQMKPVLFDKEANLRRMRDYALSAAASGADLVVFPELALTGYMCGDAFHDLAEPVSGPSVEALFGISAKTGLGLIVGMPERHGKDLYNSAVLCCPDGLKGVWRKIFLPHFVSSSGVRYEERDYFSSGLQLDVFETDFGKVGVQICYEIWFPEISRAHALQGAWLLLNISASPNGVPTTFRRLAQARAIENSCWFGYVNQSGTQNGLSFGGGTCMIDCNGALQTAASIEEKACEEVCMCDVNRDPVDDRRKNLPVLRDHSDAVIDLLHKIKRSPND